MPNYAIFVFGSVVFAITFASVFLVLIAKDHPEDLDR
jgi:hypothetical protein